MNSKSMNFSQMLDGVRIMPEEFENGSFTVLVWFVGGKYDYCIIVTSLFSEESFIFKLSYVPIDP